MTSKDAVYRELKYGLATSGALAGIVRPDHIKLDVRSTPSSTRAENDYPWILFRRLSSPEDNQVRYTGERFEIEVVGLRASATKGDDLLEQIRAILIDHFAGKVKTWGQFTAEGTPDSAVGLRMRAIYHDTQEGFDADLHEKAHVLTFSFAYIRD